MVKLSAVLIFISLQALSAQELDSLFKKTGIIPVEKEPAPPFELPDLSGNKVSLEDFQGKIVFLNFWATWCPACRVEMPSMEKLWQKFKEEDFMMLAIDLGEPEGKVISFKEEYKLTFPILLDKGKKTAGPYFISAIPTTYILDRKGKIIGKAVGAREWNSAESIQLFEYLLKTDKIQEE